MTPEKNLVIQLLMGAALIVGMLLARQKKFTAHGICQSAVVLLNLIPIFYFMAPVFHRGVQPRLFQNLSNPFYFTPGLHAMVGTVAEIFALYILLVGWKVLPASLRFDNYKKFMRIGLCLWWLTIVLGLATYYVWYLKPASSTTTTTTQSQTTNTNTSAQNRPKEVVVELTSQNQFNPKELKIEVGTTVVWKNRSGHHNVIADDSGFESPEFDAGGEFKRTFDKAGTYKYFCAFHGGPNGERMSGVIIVTPKQK
jgi:plastocyanin